MEATPIRGTEGALEPFFSPDGQSVGFWVDGQLKRVTLSGGPPVAIGETPQEPYAARWGSDDDILFGAVGGVWRVPASGGTPEVIIPPGQGAAGLDRPQLLPGGEWVLFSVVPGGQVAIESLRTGERQVLVENGEGAMYVPTGHLVYVRDGSLLAQPFDVEQRVVTPGPVSLVEGVRIDSLSAHFAHSDNGSLAYVPGGSGARTLVWVDRQGQPTPFIRETADYWYPRLSPDETRVVVTIGGDLGDIWICESGRACSPFTTDGSSYPVWTPDGTHIAFNSSREGDPDLYWKVADGSGEAERLLMRDGAQVPISWSPDGQVLAFSEDARVPGRGRDILLLPLGGEPEEYVATASNEQTPTFSPDGRWIAYHSDDSGQRRLYVRPYPGPGGAELVSLEGGEEPAWARDGRELFFRDGNRMMAIEVGDSEMFDPGLPRLLFEGYDVRVTRNYDVTRDGQRFLMVMSQEDQSTAGAEIRIVQNWFEELTERVPVP